MTGEKDNHGREMQTPWDIGTE